MDANFSSHDFLVDADIRHAETLPSAAFVDPDFLDLELETLFARTWLVVPQETSSAENMGSFQESLTKSGSRVPLNLLGNPLFLLKGQDGRLSCFPNVCTHAWHALVESPSVGGAIVCPQHGRQFDLQGRFVAQSGFEKMVDFPRESDHLKKLNVDQLGPLVFVSTGKPLAPFREFTAEILRSIPGVMLEKLVRHHVKGEVREVDGNWKQHAWNYMDNFHIRFVHKGPGGLADAIDMASYRTELHRYSALQWAYAVDPDYGFDPKFLANRFRDPENQSRRVFALWWFIFPNLALNFYPWGVSVNVYMPILGKPDKTLFLWYKYALDEEKFQQRNKKWLNEQVDAEDIEAIILVNKGARSRFAWRGRFAPNEEAGPHWFHRLVYETVFEGGD